MTTNDPLMPLLNFTPDDLRDNREGAMSEHQHYALRVRLRQSIAIGVVMTLIVAFIASLLIFSGQVNESPILTVIGIGVTVCGAAIMGIFARHWLRLNADISARRVLIVSGKLERVIKPINRRVLTYLVRVDGAEIVVAKETFEAFRHQTPYRLYRAPYTGILLAAEEAP